MALPGIQAVTSHPAKALDIRLNPAPPLRVHRLAPVDDAVSRTSGVASTSGRYPAAPGSSRTKQTGIIRQYKLPSVRSSPIDSIKRQRVSHADSCLHQNGCSPPMWQQLRASSALRELDASEGQGVHVDVFLEPDAHTLHDDEARQLTNDLSSATSVLQVKQLLTSIPVSFLNHYHVSTALWRLAHLVNAAADPEAGSHPAHAGGFSKKDAQLLSSTLKMLQQHSLRLMSQAAAEVRGLSMLLQAVHIIACFAGWIDLLRHACMAQVHS